MHKVILMMFLGLVGCASNVETPSLSDVPQTSERVHVSPQEVVDELEVDRMAVEKQREEVLKK